MNPLLDRLQPYPFERLAALERDLTPAPDRELIDLSIGEPKAPTPALVTRALSQAAGACARYPATRGEPALREVIAGWLQRRFGLPSGSIDPHRHVLPVCGTREALFAFAQCVVDASARRPTVVLPNPCYPIYEGAALLAGAHTLPVPATADSDYLPAFDQVPEAAWRDCQLLYLCSPSNPTGAVMPLAALTRLIELAHRHDFVIASDECYSEIYADEHCPPPGLLQAAAAIGLDDYRRCVVFHSLSKRSNAPGLRSGFVAGDARVLEPFYRYRTYHGCSMPPPVQQASIAAWSDEAHVREARVRYRAAFEAVAGVLDVRIPEAGFYLWLRVDGDERELARRLRAQENVRVLPGRFLGRGEGEDNPGAHHLRIALVHEPQRCREAAQRMARILGQTASGTRTTEATGRS